MVGGVILEEADGGKGLRVNAPWFVEIHDSGVPCTQFNNIDMQLALCGGEDFEIGEFGEIFELDEDYALDPLCSISLGIDWNNKE